ncbi:DUF6585 family protein [Flavobacterium sp. MMLR14_040]|uniref:DUF6585 family protein n=1 Tax=Flavobacterium sp. MMLR14_040 TaxID=3093843 RepID=UPI00298F93FB|nr:DUF6585 family protein [Flavobacterium sp. MMLR14_040]MDW8850687.1 DUF6585 family protein [Flavobacterium sp. MMLR14_040]
MKSSPELGTFIRKSAVSKAFLYFSYAILVSFTAINLFIYFKAIIPVNEGTLNFSGNVRILYYCIVFIMALGLIIFSIAVYQSKGSVFYLYQNAIVIDNKGSKEILYFKDIQDVYLFTSGKRIFDINNLAVRKNSTSPWHPISARYSDIYKVIAFIRSTHRSVNVPLLLKKLEEGESVTFTYVDFKDLAMKQFMAINTNSYLNIKTKTIFLFHDKLVFDSQVIYFKEIHHFSITDLTNQIQLINSDQETVFKKSYNSVFSGDTFTALLDELINKNKLKD